MRVITRNSVYLVEDGFVTRLQPGQRNQLRRDGERVRVVAMEQPVVGKTWLMKLIGLRENCVTYRRTTTVLAIEEER